MDKEGRKEMRSRKKRSRWRGEKNAGKRQLELSYTFPFRFSHSLYSLPNSPLKKRYVTDQRPGSKCIQKRLPTVTMASARARPEWRHTIKISNTTSATASGDKSTDRDDYEPTFFYLLFLFFVEIERSPTAAAAANRILFPGIYISGGEWTRIAVFVGEEQGARAGVKGRCQTRHKRSAELDAIAARDKMYVGEVTKELGVLLYLLVSRD